MLNQEIRKRDFSLASKSLSLTGWSGLLTEYIDQALRLPSNGV